MKITYTFPADCRVPQLRGQTVTGGVFCASSGKFDDKIDAVRFGTKVDGKQVMALIAGKPELEQALADHLAAQAAKAAILDNIGWPQYQAAQSHAISARAAYDAASEYGYPAKQAAEMRAAQDALDSARAKYPLAAAYAKAENYSMAANDQKSTAGRLAMEAIESGADPMTTIAAMEADWMDAAAKSVENN